MPMIEMKSVSKWYGTFQVLKDCTTNVQKGEVIVVCGPSGSGKSTLIKTVNALEPFQKGDIVVDGISIADPKTDLPKLRARVGMVFQHFELFPHMTALQNVTLAPRVVHGLPAKDATERAHELLHRVGLDAFAGAYPDRLSGGQQQRVAIARALAVQPRLLLLDEITSALDPELVGEVLAIVRELARGSSTILMATHEMGFARQVSDHVVFLDGGRVCEAGPPERVLHDPTEDRTRQFLARVIAAGRLN